MKKKLLFEIQNMFFAYKNLYPHLQKNYHTINTLNRELKLCIFQFVLINEIIITLYCNTVAL